PAYYAALLEGAGLTKAIDLLSLTGDLQDPRCREPMQRLADRADAMRTRTALKVTVRPINMRKYRQEARLLGAILNETLRDHFGHSPITESEWELITDSLRPVVDPRFILIAEREGKGVGLSIALPDINEIIARLRVRVGFLEIVEFLLRSLVTRPQCVTILVMGSTREGNNFSVVPLLVGGLARSVLDHGIRYIDAHEILEDNRGILAPVLRHGLVVDRRYRVYQMAL
ncbi:MAG: hypothetical protein NT031_14875, partial [Planctomycetota bacterium]|nr:hypothetical protein [Planctomycetota bacterium]